MPSDPTPDRIAEQKSDGDSTENQFSVRQPACAALQALIRWGRNPSDESRRLTPLQRSELVALAEVLVSRALASNQVEGAKLGRVQAVYIAGMIGCFDAPFAPSPFKSRDLTLAYFDQQRRLIDL